MMHWMITSAGQSRGRIDAKYLHPALLDVPAERTDHMLADIAERL
jgi:hypothetical protein